MAVSLAGTVSRTSKGVAYGIGLQAIEAWVGDRRRALFLGREGLSFAMLREMPTADQADEVVDEAEEMVEDGCRAPRALACPARRLIP